MEHLFQLAFLSWLIVITDPYQGLDYNQINVYEFEQEYPEAGITYHEAETEAYEEPEGESEEESVKCQDDIPLMLRSYF